MISLGLSVAPVRKLVNTSLAAAMQMEQKVESTVEVGLTRLLRFASIFPVAGGAIEMGYGLDELRQASKDFPTDLVKQKAARVDGYVDTARGGTAMVGSAFDLPIYLHSLFHLSHHVLTTLGVGGGIFNAINAVLDGGRDIKIALREHDTKGMWYGAAKLLAGIGFTVGSFMVSPPVLWAANAVYFGAAGVQNRKLIVQGLQKMFHKVSNLVMPDAGDGKDAAESDVSASSPASDTGRLEVSTPDVGIRRDPEADSGTALGLDPGPARVAVRHGLGATSENG